LLAIEGATTFTAAAYPQPSVRARSPSLRAVSAAREVSASPVAPRPRWARWASRPARMAANVALGALIPVGAAMASGGETLGAVPLSARLLFVIKQTIVRNAGLCVLLFALASVLFGGVMYKVTEKTELTEGTFRAYSLLNNIPGADATWDADKSPLSRLISNLLYMIGVGTFAVLIGVVSDNISSQVDGLKVSNERALEVRHTVLINWGDYTKPILRQLEAARREGRLSGPVVVLSTKDKSEMDAEVADELSRMRPPAGLTVLTRHGSPVQLNDIDRAAAGTAKRVIMLPPSAGAEGAEADATGGGGVAAATEGGEVSADVEALRQSTALLSELQASVHQKSGQRASVVVSAPPGYRAGFTKGEGFSSYAEVCAEDYVSRVISQCAVQPGLSSIYEEVLLQGKGCELYTEPLAKHKSLHGKTFGELAKRFPRAVPIGVIQHTQGGGEGAGGAAGGAAQGAAS